MITHGIKGLRSNHQYLPLNFMLMNYFSKMMFFSLITKKLQEITNERIKNVYENLVTEVLTLNQSETDYSVVFRKLNLTRIEFQSLQAQILYEQGKKCPEISLLAEGYFCY